VDLLKLWQNIAFDIYADLEVVTADQRGITLKSLVGRIGTVAWATVKFKGRSRLAYGGVTTVHTAPGSTTRVHWGALRFAPGCGA
jgi:hypothetical protein